jgi:hypothetical protein
MVAALIRRLVDDAKIRVPTHDFRKLELASLAVRIAAAGGQARTTFLFQDGAARDDLRIRSIAAFVHGWEVAGLLSRPTRRRVVACLEAVSRYRDLDVDLDLLEATWRLLDHTDGRGLPDDQRDAFEAAWIAGQRPFAIKQVLVSFRRSSLGKAWLAHAPCLVHDRPLNELVAMHRALARSPMSGTGAGELRAASSSPE